MPDGPSEINSSSEGGTAGDHVMAEPLAARVAPADQSQFNVLVSRIIPIACWRIDDIRFDFGSSFVVPETAKELAILADLREKHKLLAPGAVATDAHSSAAPPDNNAPHARPLATRPILDRDFLVCCRARA